MKAFNSRIAAVLLGTTACSGGAASGTGGSASSADRSKVDQYSQYAALEAGADYKKWKKMNKAPFLSPTHGNRFVDVYVNDVGAAAYQSGSDGLPVGSIVVKTSWETENGKPTQVAGPIFVMAKRAAGFNPPRQDWWYALHWETVPSHWQARMGGATQVYWRSPSPRVDYCWDCHEGYDRQIGFVPEESRAW
jgi:hypothetical protein